VVLVAVAVLVVATVLVIPARLPRRRVDQASPRAFGNAQVGEQVTARSEYVSGISGEIEVERPG